MEIDPLDILACFVVCGVVILYLTFLMGGLDGPKREFITSYQQPSQLCIRDGQDWQTDSRGNGFWVPDWDCASGWRDHPLLKGAK